MPAAWDSPNSHERELDKAEARQDKNESDDFTLAEQMCASMLPTNFCGQVQLCLAMVSASHMSRYTIEITTISEAQPVQWDPKALVTPSQACQSLATVAAQNAGFELQGPRTPQRGRKPVRTEECPRISAELRAPVPTV